MDFVSLPVSGHLPAAEAGYGKWPFRLACLNICRAGRNATQCILLYIVVTLPSILRKRTEELKLRLVQADGVRDLHVTGGEGLWEKRLLGKSVTQRAEEEGAKED